MSRYRWAAFVLILSVASIGLTTRPAQADVPAPTVRGPIGDAGLWGHALWDSWWDLSDVGYREDEYFISGVARSEGMPDAPFTTRVIVNRPIDPADHNGAVLLDWANVTAQFEIPVDVASAREYLLREGYAFVHVSAQAAGICCIPLTPKVWDPVRYADLDHPGDAYADDIFSQVARAMRSRQGTDPLDGLVAERVIAAGQSQSAGRLSTYVREVQPQAQVIDGFLIHGGGSKIFDTPPVVPVVHLLSDFEADPTSPNTDVNYRLWEVAGAAHADMWIGYPMVVGQGPRALAHAPKQGVTAYRDVNRVAGMYGETIHPLEAVCVVAGATFPMRYAANAAIDALDRWIAGGPPPPNGPRYRFADGALARDEHGNALGGIRLPPIAHPVATYVSTVCALGGITIGFDPLKLSSLYDDHADYYSRIVEATEASVAAGYMLPADAEDMLMRACRAPVPGLLGVSSTCDRGSFT